MINKNKILPKVTFKQMPLELEAEMFFDFLDTDWSVKITNKYPQSLGIKNIKSEKERKLAIKNEITKIREELGSKINLGLKLIEDGWKKVEKVTLETLSGIIQEPWPVREITAYISLNPICPRYLDSWNFVVTYDREDSNRIIVHEISHFLFFKKFKEIFPEISRENYESPHKEWLLSELVAVIISHDPRILNILGVKDDFYPEHKKLMAGDQLLTGVIEKLYNEFVIVKGDFEGFLRESIKLIKWE